MVLIKTPALKKVFYNFFIECIRTLRCPFLGRKTV